MVCLLEYLEILLNSFLPRKENEMIENKIRSWRDKSLVLAFGGRGGCWLMLSFLDTVCYKKGFLHSGASTDNEF